MFQYIKLNLKKLKLMDILLVCFTEGYISMRQANITCTLILPLTSVHVNTKIKESGDNFG